ncbi:MAG: transglutaminase domain-containing protein [Methanobacterium sp.]|uniref:transglutaminase-like domain-containing protein n=1 Tax=Methanobacterium sp. TaxID=2164 RepID=UPI003D653B9F|nr:transglutaminase domain-containing protein [Methanobacterium sp.]
MPETDDMKYYLLSSEIIDFEDENIQKTALNLSKDIKDETELIKTVYEFVRDDIDHSMDIYSDEVTCNATDVLKYKHGLCFAKSNLLAAILRFLEIPTGFCYQKLEFDIGMGLHGLNAVFIKSMDKWVRLDARGNKNGINAQFTTDKEVLAYSPIKKSGEIDYPTIYASPNTKVIEILRNSTNLDEAFDLIVNTDFF